MIAVYSAVYKMYSEIIDNFANSGKKPTITYEAFSNAILASECISDPRTIRTKWTAAIAQGFIDDAGFQPFTGGVLDAEMLRFRVKGCAHTQTSKICRPTAEESQ